MSTFADIYAQQLAVQTQAMQSILKANQQAYESFQTQIMKINEKAQENLSTSADDFVKQFRADCEKFLAEVKRQSTVGK